MTSAVTYPAYPVRMTDTHPPFRLDMGGHEPDSIEAGGG
jgi:hypothetical protein